MKILILNDNLRSGMQMYLALSNRYQVEIARDTEDLLKLVDQENPDVTFLDLSPEDSPPSKEERMALANLILKNHPSTKVIGICDSKDKSLRKKAKSSGISTILTRPIKNRELLQALNSQNSQTVKTNP